MTFKFHNKKSIVNFTKKMCELPPNRGTPDLIIEHIKESKLDFQEINKEFPLLNAVDRNGKVIIIKHQPKPFESSTYLVGKGLCFDTGGYNLKNQNMHEMKFDKCGAMCVYSILRACHLQNYPENIIGILPLAQNLIGESCTLPGSVITTLDNIGTEVEIVDTDAEGRLVLADVLTYLQTESPKKVISIATLTGACASALGSKYSGLFGNDLIKDDEGYGFANDIKRDAYDSGDNVWRMPLDEFHLDLLKPKGSKWLKNYTPKGCGGSTAAAFLNYFVDNRYPWVHLDIAGTAWEGDKATGRPTELLLKFLENEVNRNR